MTHDCTPDPFACSCGVGRNCPDCGSAMTYVGYDNEPRYGVGHIFLCTECA